MPESAQSLQRIGNRQYSSHVELAPYRGSILDRRGDALAISIRRPSIAINPRAFSATESEISELARTLEMPLPAMRRILESKAYFQWVKRLIPPKAAEQIAAMELQGLYEIPEPTRFYPASVAASNLIGFVGQDNAGLAGLELGFEKILRGQANIATPGRDGNGRMIFKTTDGTSPDRPGQSVRLTIDKVIQEIAESAVREWVGKAKAKSGFAIVSDPYSGKLLAIANYPNFDPNNLRLRSPSLARNFAFQDIFEPGSVMKPFVVATALEKKKVAAQEVFFCENGTYQAGGVRFRDDHPAGDLSTTDVLVRSSNICVYKIADRLGKKTLYDGFTQFGFGGSIEKSASFPGLTHGRMTNFETWKPIRFANIAFGQGLYANALEIVQGYGAIANGGNLLKPVLLDKVEAWDGTVVQASKTEIVRQVISAETARTMRGMLEKVVSTPHHGKELARSTLYTTAGKTGTTQKVDPGSGRYSATRRIASFAGFAPAYDPHLVIYVVIDEPGEKPAYGGLWAAPAFARIATESLKYLNVAPDKIAPDKKAESASHGTAKPRTL